jgi:hypothetical protein
MARPQKNGIDYFPFECDFFDDPKIVAIAGEFSIKGVYAAIRLLTAVYRNGYFLEWSEIEQMKMLRDLPGYSAELLKQIVLRLAKWGFFDENLLLTSQVLTSAAIQRRYFTIIKRRTVTAIARPYLLIDPQKLVSVCNNSVSAYNNPTQVEFLHAEIPKVKEKENKKKSIKEKADIIDIDELYSMPLYLEALKVKFHASIHRQLSDKELQAFIAEFKNHCICHPKKHIDMADLQSHFTSWLNIRLNNKNNGNNNLVNPKQGWQPTTDDYSGGSF